MEIDIVSMRIIDTGEDIVSIKHFPIYSHPEFMYIGSDIRLFPIDNDTWDISETDPRERNSLYLISTFGGIIKILYFRPISP